ncbi:MAG: diaminopimelate epimerase [Alphaproteobacteria bacterium]|nr:MAG: diaminopimelate epimerase [Alphaproteobacteria bacterium]
MGLPFLKMHGLGNDFVVLDARAGDLGLSPAVARAIADRHTGVGFDQLIVIERPSVSLADARVRFLNADGSESAACGNGTRCVARLLMEETGRDHLLLETLRGLLDCSRTADGLISVDMGVAMLDWREVPLGRACDTLHVPIGVEALVDPVGTSMGNPHLTFFVPRVEAIAMERLAPLLQRDPMLPESANIGVASVIGPDHLRLRVYERGSGLTRACGSGACAAAVAAHRRGLTGRRVTLDLDGGRLVVEWLRDGHVLMTGPTATSFAGTLDRSLLEAA